MTFYFAEKTERNFWHFEQFILIKLTIIIPRASIEQSISPITFAFAFNLSFVWSTRLIHVHRGWLPMNSMKCTHFFISSNTWHIKCWLYEIFSQYSSAVRCKFIHLNWYFIDVHTLDLNYRHAHNKMKTKRKFIIRTN